MAVPLAKRILEPLLSALGFELRRRPRGTRGLRGSAAGSLQNAKRLGLRPATVIDVGVATGTPALYEAFPGARLLLVEPLEEYIPALESLKTKYPRMEYVIAAASAEPGSVIVHVHPDLVGSSVYLEGEDSNVNGRPRSVEAVTLDQLCSNRQAPGPYVLKLDVQGAELDVLRGAQQTLRETEYLCLEVSLFEFFRGGPQLHDVVSFMKEAGFVAYDIYEPQYRPLDDAMSQIDIAFVKERSCFRRDHHYATSTQRLAQNLRALQESADEAQDSRA